MVHRESADRAWTVDDETLVRPFVRALGPTAAPEPAFGTAAPAPAPAPVPSAVPPGVAPSGPAYGRPSWSRIDVAAATAVPGRSPGHRRARGRTHRRTAVATGLLLVAAAAGTALLLRPDAAPPSAAPEPPHPSAPAGPGPSASPASGPAVSASATTDRAGGPHRATPSVPAASRPDAVHGTLRPGDSGPAVTRLQEVLFGQGKTYVGTTGRYDGATERAVREVQQERSITADPPGVFGAATMAALEAS